MSGPPNLSDRPLPEDSTLKQVIWYLNRQVVPFIRRLRTTASIIIDWIQPGDDGQVLKTVGDEVQWGQVSNENVADDAEIAVSKLADGADGDVLKTVGADVEWGKVVNANVDAAAAIAVTKLAAGNDGDVLTTVGTTPTWTPGGGGSWVTVYEPDLINEANFTYTVDGETHTVDGVDWVVDNIGLGVIEFVNGTGFRIRNGNTAAFVATNGNLTPYVILALGSVFQLAPMRGINAPIRIQFQFTLNNGFGADFQFALLGIIAEVSSADHLAEFALAGYSGGQQLRAYAALSTDVADVPVDTWTTEDVAEVRVDSNWSTDYRFGTYSGGWPEIDAARCVMVHSGQKSTGVGETFLVVSDDSTTWPIGLRSTHVYIGSQRAGGAQFDMIISRLRIQQWNDGS